MLKTKQLIIAQLGFATALIWATSASNASTLSIEKVLHKIRIQHAKELLGANYRKSVVSKAEGIRLTQKDIVAMVKAQLPSSFRSRAKRVATALIGESRRYEFDPIFLMAVIQGESSFNPTKRGHFGEIGLMQVKPDTAEWIGRISHLEWKGADSLQDPEVNIRFGAAYLAWLREKFENHAQLYLAAYNMGRGNVNSALERNIWPKDYPMHVMNRYVLYYTQIREHQLPGFVDKKILIQRGPLAANLEE